MGRVRARGECVCMGAMVCFVVKGHLILQPPTATTTTAKPPPGLDLEISAGHGVARLGGEAMGYTLMSD